jgi:hypothetical protein
VTAYALPPRDPFDDLAEAVEEFKRALASEAKRVLIPAADWTLRLYYYRAYARVVQVIAACNIPR